MDETLRAELWLLFVAETSVAVSVTAQRQRREYVRGLLGKARDPEAATALALMRGPCLGDLPEIERQTAQDVLMNWLTSQSR